jgi:hypothetical protein
MKPIKTFGKNGHNQELFINESIVFIIRLTNVTSSYSSISGAATSLIQNFQIQNMLKETASTASSLSTLSSSVLLDSSKKLNEAEICRICSILCTAEYCLETTQQV